MTQAGGWFHCSVKPISRSAGRSVVAAAAYRSGERLRDDRTQQTHDYRRRIGVEAAFIVAPADAPDWVYDAGKLWNAAETVEKRSNSQTAREVELALPSAVDGAEREAIARQLAEHLAERYGVAVAVALHQPSEQGDERNHHAHILMTTRRMEADGLGAKTRELDDKKTGGQEVRHIREYACDLINASLERAGLDERVDHRSFKERGIEQVPSEHLGVEASGMERRGKRSRRGDLNRENAKRNQRINELTEQRTALDGEIEREEASHQGAVGKEAESGSYWRDRINGERETSQEDPPPASPQGIQPEESKAAQSAFADSIALASSAQLNRQGEVKHGGLALSWVEHAKEQARELWQELLEMLKEEERQPPDRSR
ncbi:MobA/MobL family protein [Methylomagnum ishizawai]|uniref:MobA/MobL family protein n=1 Tax=Methylomagnum ishizawai TaxID=1760988 RepID=A0A1Y6D5E2_9GAMM|nr:MobQ family relaxase [Methylomagnum ishizawai]SMF97897.1 MobA/MobL family protein [Methylomagnum ishizawai]